MYYGRVSVPFLGRMVMIAITQGVYSFSSIQCKRDIQQVSFLGMMGYSA